MLFRSDFCKITLAFANFSLSECVSVPAISLTPVLCDKSCNLRYADDTTLVAESREELKCLLMTMKEESEKAGLKLNIQKTKIMASGPITSWQIDGKQWKHWAPKLLQMVTAAMKLKDTCSLEVKL